jgi:hypothetical protein
VAFVVGKLQVFFLPFSLNTALGVPADPTTNNKLFTFQGDVVQGVASMVHIPDDWFNLTARVLVPTVTNARGLLAADTDTSLTFGPYAAGDVDTEEVCSRKVCVLPTKYAGYFLSQDGGVEPRKYIDELLVIMEADNNAVALKLLTHFVLSAMMATAGVSAVTVTAPLPVPQNVALITHSQTILHSHLTGLVPSRGAQESIDLIPLISAINAGHNQATTRANEDHQERQAKDIKLVASMLGEDYLRRLLGYCGVLDEASLPPMWAVLANAPKSNRLHIFHGKVADEYIAQGLQFEHHVPTLGFFNNFMTMNWMPFNEAIETGSLANPFQFGDTNQEDAHNINRHIQLICHGGATPT